MHRRTVVLNPEIEAVVSTVQAFLVKLGWTASFSSTVNLLVLSYFQSMLLRATPRREIAERARIYLQSRGRTTGITKEELQAFDAFIDKAQALLGKKPTDPNYSKR